MGVIQEEKQKEILGENETQRDERERYGKREKA